MNFENEFRGRGSGFEQIETEVAIMTVDLVTTLLGWCLVINVVMMIVAAVAVMVFRAPVMRMHGKLFGLSEDDFARAYFSYFAHYKIVVLVFNLAPYVVVKLLT